ncbi:hypothetical protein C8R44DRAFT_752388 [Mycena epipterygia]|nr:hypothetical protein C8R44DRAFT_752388 [Mycena epipterygia]
MYIIINFGARPPLFNLDRRRHDAALESNKDKLETNITDKLNIPSLAKSKSNSRAPCIAGSPASIPATKPQNSSLRSSSFRFASFWWNKSLKRTWRRSGRTTRPVADAAKSTTAPAAAPGYMWRSKIVNVKIKREYAAPIVADAQLDVLEYAEGREGVGGARLHGIGFSSPEAKIKHDEI